MNPREFHPYGYDNQRSGLTDQIATSGVEFVSTVSTDYTYENHNQYYANPSHGIGDVNRIVNTSEPYFRSMTPGTYSHVNRDQQYSTSQDFASAPPLTPGMYQEIQQYPSHCFPMSSQSGFHPNDNDAVQQTRFIPTPSQIAHTYSTYSQQTSAHTIQGNFFDPSSFDYEAANQMSFSTNGMHPQPSRIITTGRPRGSSAANLTCPNSSTSSPLSERFPCEKCGKTFSRSHDRKRHYETQHLPTPILHRCVYCRKEFSRADSLKRHLDNGCDEMHL